MDTISDNQPQPIAQVTEAQLRVLHELLLDALSFPGLSGPYTAFLRSLRERLHPVGVPEQRVIEFQSGLRFKVDLGDRLGCDVYYGYYQEYFDACLFLGLLAPGSTVLDVGANFGYYAVTAASRIGEQGRVYAFEPNPDAYQLLQKNVELNRLQAIVHLHSCCVGASDGETDFYLSEESSFSGIGETGRSKLRQKLRIPMVSLDSLASEQGLPPIDAAKVDVEGYEFAVLNGALETVKRSPNLVIMMEVSAKNLTEQRRAELVVALEQIYQLGFRGWISAASSEGLELLPSPEAAANLGGANLFLVASNSEREQQLHRMCQALRVQAFRSIAQELSLSVDSLLSRNAADPWSYAKLHSALLDSLMRNRDAVISSLQSRLLKTEEDSRARLEEIRKRDAVLKGIHSQSIDAEKELHLHDESLKKLQEELRKRDEELRLRSESLQLLQKELRKRDEELRLRGESLQLLQKDLIYWKAEAKLGIWEQIQQKFKKFMSAGQTTQADKR